MNSFNVTATFQCWSGSGNRPAAGGNGPRRNTWRRYIQNAFDLALCRSARCIWRAVNIHVFFGSGCDLTCVAIGGDSVKSPAEFKPRHDVDRGCIGLESRFRKTFYSSLRVCNPIPRPCWKLLRFRAYRRTSLLETVFPSLLHITFFCPSSMLFKRFLKPLAL